MDLYYKRTEFPVQKMPLIKKDEAWRQGCVDVLISREGSTFTSGRSRKDILRVNYDLYSGVFNEDDLKYVLNPFNVEDGFPAHPQSFNIIKPKIDLLIGEETKRPFNFRVFSTSEQQISQVQDYLKESLIKEYLSTVTDGTSEEQTDQKMQEIDTYVKNSYNTSAEQCAYNTLKYLRQYLSIDHETVKGWKDGLVAGEEIYYVGIVNGEPMCERVNPYQFTFDNDPDLEFIEDGDWACRRFLMSPGGIYDRFQDMMTEEDLDKLLEMTNGDSLTRRPSDVNYNSIIYRDKIMSDINHDEFFKGQLLPVWHVVWKSFKKFGTINSTDPETGKEHEEIVDETYSLSDEEKASGTTIEWDWLSETWEGFRIGTDIYLDIRPVQYQYQSLDNPKVSKLPYVGGVYNSTNVRNRSLVDIMKPLQYMYIIIWYRLELALARDKGKVINMDITQIPKSMGIDVKQWMHYLSALGVNLINPYEEGWDIPGREGGRSSSFNQFGQVDLSMSNVITDYIGLLNKIEDMIGELSGVSKQRQGSISSDELVGNVQRSVVQSSHITEPLFEVHNNIKKRLYTALLNVAKFAWSENNKKKLNFIVDDFVRVFLDFDDEFLYSDFNVFVSDSTRENQNLEQLKQLIQPAMQNGATLSDAAMLLMSDSMSEITRKFKDIERKRQEQEQQQAQQQQQMQAQLHQEEMQAAAEDRRIKEEDSIRKAETSIQVALIQAESKGNNSTGGEVSIEDNSLEELRVRLQEDKQNAEDRYNQDSLSETIRSNKKQEELKKEELSIKSKQVSKKPTSSK
jgi:hypothetical protein